MLLIYINKTICIYHDVGAVQKLAEELKKSFNITIEGTIRDFLGVQFKRQLDGTFALSQPQLIDSILPDLKLINGKRKKAKPKQMPIRPMSFFTVMNTCWLTQLPGSTAVLLAS